MLTQMAKYLDTVYVSGWQSSSTASASDEPGPDLADYPYASRAYSPTSGGLTDFIPDNGPKQSPTFVHGTTFPRPEATRRACDNSLESRSQQIGERRLSPTHYRRC